MVDTRRALADRLVLQITRPAPQLHGAAGTPRLSATHSSVNSLEIFRGAPIIAAPLLLLVIMEIEDKIHYLAWTRSAVSIFV